MYYFNCQSDENGFMQFNALRTPSIDGNILTLPCVRQNDMTGGRENLILKIDFVKGTIISKMPV